MTDSTNTVSDDAREKIGELVTSMFKLGSIAKTLESGMRDDIAASNAVAVQDDGNIVINTKLISSVLSGCMKNFAEELSKIGFKKTTE